jgi:hypothetical protein
MKTRAGLKRVMVALVALAAMAVPAAAASWHSISGTAYSDGSTYVSQNVRLMTSTSPIRAQFSTLPKNGLVFGTRTQTGVFLGQNTWASSEINITRGVRSLAS